MTEPSDNLIQTRDNLHEVYQHELNLPDHTIERAAEILNKAAEESLTTSRCHRTIIAATTLLACREQDVPRVADDFSEHTIKNNEAIDSKKISKESRKIKRKLELFITPTDSSRYLDYYADQLELSGETRSQARRLLKIAEQNGIATGPSPTSMAAACIDAARRLTGENLYQHEISNVTHVSEPQMRKHCQKLMDGPTA